MLNRAGLFNAVIDTIPESSFARLTAVSEMLGHSVESFLVVSESFSPTNSVMNPPETNGFLIGARLDTDATTGGSSPLSVTGSAVKGAVLVVTVDAGEATIVWADCGTGV